MENIKIKKENFMSKNRYTDSALKEATNIVEKCIRRKTKKSKTKKLFLFLFFAISISVAFFLILPLIFKKAVI